MTDNADCAAVAGRWFVCLVRVAGHPLSARREELSDSHNELDWCLTGQAAIAKCKTTI